MIDSDLVGLNVTSHLVAHSCTFSISKFNRNAASTGSSTMIYRLVSSAKSRIDELIFSTMLYIYNRNNRGPKIEPWGTPDFKED